MALRWFGCPDCGGKMSKSATVCQHCGANVNAVEQTTLADWLEEKPKEQRVPQNIQASGPRLILFAVSFLLMVYASIKSGGNWIILILTLVSAYAVYADWQIMKKWLKDEADAKDQELHK